MVVWLHGRPLDVGRSYLVKHTARQTKIRALQIRHRVNVNTLEQEEATQLNMNDIASVEFEAHVPLFFDSYSDNRITGSFILIDELSNATVGAGMIEEAASDGQRVEVAELEIVEGVSARERYERHGHYPATFLLENQPAVASRLERALFERGFEVLHFGDRDAASSLLMGAVHVAHRIGCVFIYSGGVLDAETRQRLASLPMPRLLDLSRESEEFDDERLFRHALELADSLRITEQENQEKVN